MYFLILKKNEYWIHESVGPLRPDVSPPAFYDGGVIVGRYATAQEAEQARREAISKTSPHVPSLLTTIDRLLGENRNAWGELAAVRAQLVTARAELDARKAELDARKAELATARATDALASPTGPERAAPTGKDPEGPAARQEDPYEPPLCDRCGAYATDKRPCGHYLCDECWLLGGRDCIACEREYDAERAEYDEREDQEDMEIDDGSNPEGDGEVAVVCPTCEEEFWVTASFRTCRCGYTFPALGHWSYALQKSGASREMQLWADERASFEEAWNTCIRPEWLICMAADKNQVGSQVHKQIVLALCAATRLVLVLLTQEETRPSMAIAVAERWARGEASIEDVNDAREEAKASAKHIDVNDVAVFSASCAVVYTLHTILNYVKDSVYAPYVSDAEAAIMNAGQALVYKIVNTAKNATIQFAESNSKRMREAYLHSLSYVENDANTSAHATLSDLIRSVVKRPNSLDEEPRVRRIIPTPNPKT